MEVASSVWRIESCVPAQSAAAGLHRELVQEDLASSAENWIRQEFQKDCLLHSPLICYQVGGWEGFISAGQFERASSL